MKIMGARQTIGRTRDPDDAGTTTERVSIFGTVPEFFNTNSGIVNP